MIAVPAVGARSNFPRGILGFVFGFVFAFALGLVGVKYITLVPQYSESARARARRLNEAERNQWDWPSANPLTPARGSETVEWLNAALRKVWRVYMKQIERWIENRLQRAIDGAVLRRKIKQRKESEKDGDFPLFNLNRVKLVELTLDFQPPVLRAIESRSESRRDSEIGAIANLRYTGGLRALFMIEVSISLQDAKGEDLVAWQQRMWRNYMSMEDEDKGVTALAPISLNRPWIFRIPVQVYDLDIESDLWVRAKLAPLAPYVGQLSLAFVDSPAVGVQLAPYKRVQLMRIPVVQSFLSKLITEDLPSLMILPRKLTFEIPPSLAAVAGAAIGEDIVKKSILSAVVNSGEQKDISAEKMEETLTSLMDKSKTPQEIVEIVNSPLNQSDETKKAGVMSDAAAAVRLKELVKPWTQGGITLPQVFQGELLVTLNSARGLPGWTGVFGEPIPDIFEISSPYCMLRLGSQVDYSRKFQKMPNKKNPFPPLPLSKPKDGALYESIQTEPVWNQEFQFLVQDKSKDELVIQVKDQEFLGRSEVGYATLRVADLEVGVQTPVYLTLQPPVNTPGMNARSANQGEVFIEATYRNFADSIDEESEDKGSKIDLQKAVGEGGKQITDIKSAAEASIKAGVRSSMTARALAITKAASVRASLALKRFGKEKRTVAAEIVMEGEDNAGTEIEAVSERKVEKMMEALQDRLEKEEISSEKRAARWIARSDRPWFQLVSFLLGVVIVLLVLIAYRVNLAINIDLDALNSR